MRNSIFVTLLKRGRISQSIFSKTTRLNTAFNQSLLMFFLTVFQTQFPIKMVVMYKLLTSDVYSKIYSPFKSNALPRHTNLKKIITNTTSRVKLILVVEEGYFTKFTASKIKTKYFNRRRKKIHNKEINILAGPILFCLLHFTA